MTTPERCVVSVAADDITLQKLREAFEKSAKKYSMPGCVPVAFMHGKMHMHVGGSWILVCVDDSAQRALISAMSIELERKP